MFHLSLAPSTHYLNFLTCDYFSRPNILLMRKKPWSSNTSPNSQHLGLSSYVYHPNILMSYPMLFHRKIWSLLCIIFVQLFHNRMSSVYTSFAHILVCVVIRLLQKSLSGESFKLKTFFPPSKSHHCPALTAGIKFILVCSYPRRTSPFEPHTL